MSLTFPIQTPSHFLLPGPAGALELLTTYPKNPAESFTTVIICHPHPLFGGTMDNKVITTLAKAFDELGLATIRFNFRGIGKSEGQYGQMIGEIEDLKAVLNWVKKTLPNSLIWLAGFSFGAYISAAVANDTQVEQLISVAPAVNHGNFNLFNQINAPWLIIQGDQDEIVPVELVKSFAKSPPSPLTLKIMENASHFFHGKLIELRELLMAFFHINTIKNDNHSHLD